MVKGLQLTWFYQLLLQWLVTIYPKQVETLACIVQRSAGVGAGTGGGVNHKTAVDGPRRVALSGFT